MRPDAHATARRIIDAAAKPIPAYRSPEWEALPSASVERMAAVFIAAEAWHDMHRIERIAERCEVERWEHMRYEHEAQRQASEAVRQGLAEPHPWSERGVGMVDW